LTVQIKALWSFKVLGTMHPTTQHNIAQALKYVQVISSEYSLMNQQVL
jgi:hypothetical protein